MRSGHFRNGEQVGEWITYDQQGQVYKVTNMDKKRAGRGGAGS
jgi:antitoxin component YwqK of YwqJK toxin-antitoxin module